MECQRCYPLYHYGEPTRTPLVYALGKHLEFVLQTKTKASYTSDRWHLRRAFGTDGGDTPLWVLFVEDLTPAALGAFFLRLVCVEHYQPKTYNRFREVVHRFVNWCIRYKGTRFAGGFNPASRVERQQEHA